MHVETYETALSSDNALELFEPTTSSSTAPTTFPTRYLVNDACVLLGKPNAYGSIFRFEGQASVFATKDGPCYRCLYPEPPPPGLVPSCAEGGVLGVLPGIIGTIQATETIKLILGIGEPLVGRFLIYDALRMRFRELKLRKDPECPVCGTNPTVTQLIDYEQFCGVAPSDAGDTGADVVTDDITPLELKERMDRGEPHGRSRRARAAGVPDQPHPRVDADPARRAAAALRGARPERRHRLPVQVGRTQRQGRGVPAASGFKNVRNLTGGILGWIDQVDPSQPKY